MAVWSAHYPAFLFSEYSALIKKREAERPNLILNRSLIESKPISVITWTECRWEKPVFSSIAARLGQNRQDYSREMPNCNDDDRNMIFKSAMKLDFY